MEKIPGIKIPIKSPDRDKSSRKRTNIFTSSDRLENKFGLGGMMNNHLKKINPRKIIF